MNFEKLHHAVIFATHAHRHQNRKTENVPYITHPYTAALFAIPYVEKEAFTEDEKTDIITAIILHDVWEDTDTLLSTIEERFGKLVSQLVKGASESDKTLPWLERKQETIHKLNGATLAQKYVICADKIHNLTSIIQSDEFSTGEIWKYFKSEKDLQRWYYESIYVALIDGTSENHLFFERLKKLIDKAFTS
ncbi:HD domain-containing protein [Evansella halocellulosilytica]|uniref:HD domain-containing protein n=1 Tax=Evansella halocellulosilytica TaxID=2011013 RepID=UPI000BB84E24|nr:HD domain-containing protein [Evansella halocellulosilytica]